MGDSRNVKIIQTIASGGTAVLHKAVQTSLDRIVAVKRLHKHLTDDENFTRRFILEAKAAASLDHENIVHVIDFGRYEDGYEIVMEYVEGDSVKEVLDRWRPVQHELALAIVHQICLGLEHAHSKGIVHRDIKPGNVMLTRAGRAKITDFGLAKLTEAAASHTADNSIIGTPLYMSPEQAFGESVDQRSDLFSLGTMLYELVTGKQPFASENYMGVIQNIIHKDIVDPRTVNPELPEEVEDIILRALSKDREQRFQSAREFRQAIEAVIGIVELNALADRVGALLERNTATQLLPRPDVVAAPKRVKSGHRRSIAAVVVAVAVIGAVGTALVRPDLIERLFGNELSGAPPPAGIQRSEAVVTPVDATFDLGALVSESAQAGSDTTGVASGATAGVSAESHTEERTDPAPPGEPPPAQPATEPEATSAPEATPTPAPTKVARMGFLTVDADPGAEVYVDGVYRGDAPPALRLKLVSGNHTVECRRPGHESYRESLRIIPGELSRRAVKLKRLKGIISLTTQQGAEVYIDGRLLGMTPFHRPIELDAGEHMVTIKKPGFNTWSSQVSVQPKETLPLNITLSRRY